MKFKEIKTKRRGSQMYSQGLFGNTLKTWKSVEAYLADPDKYNKVVIRQTSSGGGGLCVYDVPEDEVADLFKSYQDKGLKGLYLSEQLPGQPECITFQGEYIQGGWVPAGEHLRYSTAKAFHRDAMVEGKNHEGPGCRLILQQAMSPQSYDTLMEFADLHENHVIEFSISNQHFGSLGKEMIIWEIRKY